MSSHDERLAEAFPFLTAPTETLSAPQIRFRDQVGWLNKLPTDFGSILDVGAGAGYQSKYFELMGHPVTACDMEDRFLFKDSIEFHHASLDEFPSDKKFDAIITSHVIEHVMDLGRFLGKLKDLLNDDGYLIIFVPNTHVTENGHWHEGWSITQLGTMLTSLGFDCRDSFFTTFGYHTLGFGRKTNRQGSEFMIDECLPYLPAKFADLRIVGHFSALQRNVSYVDKERIVRTLAPHELVDRAALNAAEARYSHVRETLDRVDVQMEDVRAKLTDADARLAEAQGRLAGTEAKLSSAEAEVAALRDQLAEVYASRSWAITRPLRQLISAIRS